MYIYKGLFASKEIIYIYVHKYQYIIYHYVYNICLYRVSAVPAPTRYPPPVPVPVPVQCTGSSTSTVSSASITTTTTRGCMKTMIEIQSTSICGFRFELRIPFSQSYYTRPHGLMHERAVGSWRIKQSDGEVLRRKNNMNVVHCIYIYNMNINRFWATCSIFFI